MFGWKKYALAVLIMLVAIGTLFATHPQKTTLFQGACKATGVSVTVDFGNKILNRCVVGQTSDSWTLLKQAGFAIRGTDDYPTGFVCQINGQPADQNCKHTPTNSQERWSFYVSSGDGSAWSYSLQGASSQVPTCGSAVLWTLNTKPSGKPRTFKCR